MNPHLEEVVEIYRNDFNSEEDLLEFIEKWISEDKMPDIKEYINK